MSRSYFTQCPRCGTRSYENLNGYGHCIECFYSDALGQPKKRDFLTLKEAMDLIKIVEGRKNQNKSKNTEDVDL